MFGRHGMTSSLLRSLFQLHEKGKRQMVHEIKALVSALFGRRGHSTKSSLSVSYSQFGEDKIIRMAANLIGIKQVRYLDIGCFDAQMLNNTYLFYLEGGSGICVDPNAERLAGFKSTRPRDILIEAGVTEKQSGHGKYFMLDDDSLNTFCEEEAARLQATEGHTLIEVRGVPVINISDLVQMHFPNGRLDLVSLDVEGLDLSLLQAFNFQRLRPPIWCVETIEYCRTGKGRKTEEIVQFMASKDYFVFADTYVNTIFVDKNAWDNARRAD